MKAALVALAALCAATLCVVNVRSAGRSVLAEVARRQQLVGEDKDWDVKSWSAKHRLHVGTGKLDKATVKNIWTSSSEAWKGIDSVLPTGGRYGYEEDHKHNAADAKMLLFLHAAEKHVRAMEAALPARGGSKADQAAVRETMGVLRHDDRALHAFEHRIENPARAAHAAPPQMLAQGGAGGGRVFVDDALYGEGIQGDMRSQGHNEARWNARGGQRDMDRYFTSLSAADGRELAQAKRRSGVAPWGASDRGMGGYWHSLARRGKAQDAHHEATLRNDHYFAQHPFEHPDLHAWVRASWGGKSAGGAAERGGGGAAEEWERAHGMPKTEKDLAAFARFAAERKGAAK